MSDGLHKYLYKILLFKTYILSIVIALIVLFSCLYLLSPVNISKNNYTFEIKSGDSLYKISNNLSKDKIINYPRLLRLYTYILGVDNNIHTGEYELTNKSRIYDLITKISVGDVKQYKLTILEGDVFANVKAQFKQSNNLVVTNCK